ncbi:MAG: exo-alpha-sialidase [Reyranellaceae bacterium]
MRTVWICLIALLGPTAALAQHQGHGGGGGQEPEAFTATPAFGPDGALWLARTTGNRVLVAKSTDLGRTFAPTVAVTPQPLNLDWGPDARPHIAVDQRGDVIVTFALFQDKRFNGRAYFARSSDGGASFAAPQPLTRDATSQRFERVALDPTGRPFAAWLDKRNVAPAKAAGRSYAGAALAYAWSDDHGGSFGDTRIAHDNTCECCRLGVAFAGPGRPAVVFRNIFDGSVRDHAVVTFKDADTVGSFRRVSVDDWKIEACPHHGPSLAIAKDGSYHVAWFTDGRERKGLFYARASSETAPFETPRPLSSPERQPSRPFLLAAGNDLHLVWKEFDGSYVRVLWQVSRDSGRTWSTPQPAAQTDDASDHPLLVASGGRAYLSWLTKSEGFRLIPLEDKP